MTCKHCGGDITEQVALERVEEAARRVVEHLGRASKAVIVDPPITRLADMLGRRFRAQGRAYAVSGFYLKVAAIGLSADQNTAYRAIVNRQLSIAYNGGAAHVGGQLAVLTEAAKLKTAKQPPGYSRTASDLEDEIDATTQERIASIESDGVAKGFTVAAIATAVRQQFREWANGAPGKTSRAETIATHEVSAAFHAGGADVASIVADEGTAVEKSWDGEPDACEEVCQPNIDQGWIDESEIFESGESEPPGHPNCRCSVSYRTAGVKESDAARWYVFSEDYNPDQPRDEHGRWVSTGAHETGIRLSHSDSRAYNGKQVDLKSKLSKLETGALGEKILLEHLKLEGHADAHPLNAHTTNFPVDGIQNHEVIEMKTGIVSNGRSAQQWRATIGQPGKEETKWLKTASADEKRAWNQGKAQAILDRKEAAVQSISKELGRPVKGSTMTVLLNPDTHTADIYKFDGFHSRIDWNSAQAKAGYVRSVAYGHI